MMGKFEVNSIIQGHVLDVLKGLPDECVHMAVTSPPYWGLRNYGTEPEVWGGDVECGHSWGKELVAAGSRSDSHPGEYQSEETLGRDSRETSAFCSLCGAWRGSLGLEPSPDLYVQHLVDIFREVRRVLRSDGTLWLNLGSSYAGSGSGGGGNQKGNESGKVWFDSRPTSKSLSAFKPKDLVPIPWMVAMALQADGWWLRSSIIWAKGLSFAIHDATCPDCGRTFEAQYSGSSMPGSVRDRPTRSYEYVFLLTKNSRYFYDQEAVKEPTVYPLDNRKPYAPGQVDNRGNGHDRGGGQPTDRDTSGRNLRSVWAINPHPWRQAHFATYPPVLIEPMILAGTSANGVCPECGNPWERVVKRINILDLSAKGSRFDTGKTAQHQLGRTQKGKRYTNQTIGWQPTCSCGHTETVPAIVLDPFMGSGTTALVALEHGRQFVGIELNPEYIQMAYERIHLVQPKLL